MDFKTLVISFFLLSSSFAVRPGYKEPWGKDAGIKSPLLEKKETTLTSKNPLVKAMDLAVKFHIHVISPVDGPRSHFRPTSSKYMIVAMKRHGFIRGFLMGCDRLMRENNDPWIYRKREINGTVYKWDPTIRSY